MTEILIRFLKLTPVTINSQAFMGMAAVWLLLLLPCIGSLVSQPWARAEKAIWALVLLIPVAGALLYSVTCLLRADYSSLKFLGFKKRNIR